MQHDQALDRQILSLANDLTDLVDQLHRLSDDGGYGRDYITGCEAECVDLLQRTQALFAGLSHDNR
jgi:hypothetical protein